MLFNSITFIILHFVTVFLFWSVSSQKIRQVLLLISSLIFYGWYYWPGLILLLISMVFNYYFSLKISSTKSKKVLAIAVVANLCSLAWFKYSSFIFENISALFISIGLDLSIPVMNSWLPLGISFYSFQIIAYLVDVYRNEVPVERSFISFGVFKCYYAQLIAGPIVRAKYFFPQLLQKRDFCPDKFKLGFYYMLGGLTVKICIADTLAQFVDYGFENPDLLSNKLAWLTLYGFSFQILSDFWGYSTIAIGIAYMYGLELPVNFMSPYTATSITVFWRRWHITLSRWLRDYLYISLGGNRKNQKRNLILTMGLGGLWHGASWNFIIWGLGHGIWLMMEKIVGQKFPNIRVFKWIKILFVFHVVAILWVFFRAANFSDAMKYLSKLFINDNINCQISPTLISLLIAFVLFQKYFGKSLTDKSFLNWSLTKQLLVSIFLIFIMIAYANARLDFIYFVF